MKIVRHIIAIPGGILVAGVAFVCVEFGGQALGLEMHYPSLIWFPFFVVLCVTVPLACGFFAACWIAQLPPSISSLIRKVPRSVVIVVFAAYLVTWAFGVPAVLTAEHKTAVDAYKKERARNNRVWDAHPWIRTAAAFPILPGLVVSFHEYQVAGLDGWGGWQVYVWYWNGVRKVFEQTYWIS